MAAKSDPDSKPGLNLSLNIYNTESQGMPPKPTKKGMEWDSDPLQATKSESITPGDLADQGGAQVLPMLAGLRT